MATTEANTVSRAVVDLLSRAATFPERPDRVDVIETHISWVFLTPLHAYKLKKPVRFEFLDFSTPALRHEACDEELRLNRRLAPDVYLAVLPITRDERGALRLGGDGAPVDHVVQMRRLAADLSMDVLLARGRLTNQQAQAVAERLAAFYSGLAPQQPQPDEFRAALARHIRANGDALRSALPSAVAETISRIIGAQLRYLALHAPRFDERIAAGRIVDGHGDLRPEHIYLEDPPVIIDCLEFSAELRRGDVADELSFLAMECDRLARGDVGERVISTYRQRSDDEIPALLLAFYRGYRACVRAKVAALRADQTTGATHREARRLARQYLDWADRYAAQLGPPMLLLVGGLMGTGKSTLARSLADSLGAERISTDHIRQAMLGPSRSPAGYAEGIYAATGRQRVYDQMLREAAERLDRGQSAVLDGTFTSRVLRQRAFDIARERGAIPLAVMCECPRPVALARIEQRSLAGGSESEARAELFDRQAAEFEPLEPGEPSLAIGTTQPLDLQAKQVYRELRRLAD